MPEWKYRKIDLNQYRPRGDELDLLNAAGAEGWGSSSELPATTWPTSNARWTTLRQRRTPEGKLVVNTGIQTDTMPRTKEQR